MGWKEFKEKFEKFNNLLDINRLFPNYINKTLFRICFGAFIFYTIGMLIFTHGQIQWNYIECNSDKMCNSPFYLCNLTVVEELTSEYKTPSVRMAIQQIKPEDRESLGEENNCIERALAPKWIIDFCDTYGCPKYMQPHEIIGSYPPVQVRQYPYMVGMLLLVTFLINHIWYVKNKPKVENGNN